MELQGRIALITGAGSGLGLATAQAFAREGATVVVNDLRLTSAEETASSLGANHSAVGGRCFRREAGKTHGGRGA
jgi:NAD(P)-dependent dehydrogenase (short-subunit alcohol dehydrogenase family)